MIDLLRQNARTIALVAGTSGVLLVTLSASQPVQERDVPLTVASGDVPIGIVGRPDGLLRPGAIRHLDLTLSNSSRRDIVLTSVSVSVASVSAPQAHRGRPCLVSDFVVSPGRLAPVAVGAGQTTTLSDTGAPRSSWPSVRMINSSANQDGCKGSAIILDYRAVGEVR